MSTSCLSPAIQVGVTCVSLASQVYAQEQLDDVAIQEIWQDLRMAQADCRQVCAPGESRNSQGCCAPADAMPLNESPLGPSERRTGQPAESSEMCPVGQYVTLDTAGRCCWEGQAWNGNACVGSPTYCPAGLLISSSGCDLPICGSGQVRNDSGQCCWPGQAWSTAQGRCLGEAVCPSGFEQDDGGLSCVSLEELASQRSAQASAEFAYESQMAAYEQCMQQRSAAQNVSTAGEVIAITGFVAGGIAAGAGLGFLLGSASSSTYGPAFVTAGVAGGIGLILGVPMWAAPNTSRVCVRPVSPGTGRANAGCENSCSTAYDNECDDGGPGSLYSICGLGTDCADCGAR
jgi:hypothetical protein